MVGNGKVKSILLLALGFAVIALAGPAAGDTGDHCLDKETCMVLQQSSMGDCQLNGTLTCCMIDENMSNESCYMAVTNESCYMAGIGQNATVQARLNCTGYWLEKAIELHELHMKNPSTATNESQMELMDYLMHAHECMKGENMTQGMANNTTGVQFSGECQCGC
ncbi:hypothetical protein RSJ42_02630 [Methanosarcina hadiensis]|uniref:hypothetical protein n=1 Tax=Methanosarcina hadiensis TaxID=3078083 RepID=UPI0039778A43